MQTFVETLRSINIRNVIVGAVMGMPVVGLLAFII